MRLSADGDFLWVKEWFYFILFLIDFIFQSSFRFVEN